jgi:hypothetical protein
MKKNTIIASAILVIGLCSAKAQESIQISESISERFGHEYSGASNVEWSKANEAVVAQFRYLDNFWVAYYKADGEKFASGRKIATLDQLPLSVQQGILNARINQERKFGPMNTSYAMEMIEDGTTKYYLPMANVKVSLILTVDNSGNTIVTRKEAKQPTVKPDKDLLAKKN